MTDWIDAIDWSAGSRVGAEAEKEWDAMMEQSADEAADAAEAAYQRVMGDREDGPFAHIPIDRYHANTRVSSSMLKTFNSLGARGYQLRHLLGQYPLPQTKPMLIGQAFEDLVCGRSEPIIIEGDGRTTAVKAQKAEAEAKNEERVAKGLAPHPIFTGKGTSEVSDFMRQAHINFMKNDELTKLVGRCVEQPTLFGSYPGLPGLQARPDWGNTDGEFPDLKVTEDLDSYMQKFVKFDYHVQAALVRRCAREMGIEKTTHMHIVAERRVPFRVQVMDIPEELMQIGEARLERSLEELAECYRRDEWPLCAQRIVMRVPAWMLAKKEG